MAIQIQLRRGTAAAWTAANPTLAVGELVIETDTDKYKIGDGSTAWTSLGYSSLPADAITTAGGVTITVTMTHGADGTGADVRFNSGTAGDYMLWDASEEQLVITGTNGAVALNVADGNATFADDVTITGNLTVNGATTTVSTTNTVVADSLFELNNGASSNANDCGIVIERGSTGDNAIIAWDESADKFTMGTTTATGASTGDLSITAGTLVADLEGDVTGDVTGNASGTAATVTGAAQSAITSVGTMTGLAVDGTSQLYECVTEAISGNKTPALTDAGKVFYCSQSGGTQTITIDGSISWPVGTQMVFVASNTSTVTFAESNSTSLDSKDDNKSIDGRYASAALINYGSNTWFLIGALA
jgi:hypothetical protein